MDFDPDAFKRMDKFKILVESKDGHAAFYGTLDRDWKARIISGTLGVLKSFEQRIITIA